jgi:hypothetical protein
MSGVSFTYSIHPWQRSERSVVPYRPILKVDALFLADKYGVLASPAATSSSSSFAAEARGQPSRGQTQRRGAEADSTAGY